MPVPNPPGIVAAPPRAIGNRTSIARWPVMSGVDGSSRAPIGRGSRTGQRLSIVTGRSSIHTTGSSSRAGPERIAVTTAADVRRNEDPMLERRRLGDDAEQIAGRDGGTLRDARLERPRTLAIERRHVDAAREQRAPERIVAVAGEHLERALRAVEDATEQAGTELDLQRTAGVEHRLADPQPGGVLVDLDRGPVAVEADDLAGERGLADAHDVVQPHAVEPARDHDRPGDAPDLTRVVAAWRGVELAHRVLASSPNVIS